MDVAADLEHLRSLDAISRAYRASKSTAQPLVEIPTSIVRDMLNSRVFQSTGSATTTYPNKYFALLTTTIGSSTLATSTDYIFSGSQLLGTIEGGKYATTTRYMDSDNLGSTDAVTNASGTPVQALDYYPYGSTRIASSTAGTDEKHKYIGQYYDASGLDYLNARYYDSSRGQFLSQDPIFLSSSSSQNFGDPQSLNSYSYSEGNPIIKEDPSGKCIEDGCVVEIIGLGTVAGGAGGALEQALSDIQHGQVSSPSTYAASIGKGAFVGGTVAAAGIFDVGAVALGGISALANGLGTVAENQALGNRNNWGDIALDSAITGVTGGILEGVTPGVPGRIPNLFSEAFFTGSHMTSLLSQNLIDIEAHATIPIFSNSINLFGNSRPYVVNNNVTYIQSSGGGLSQTSLPASVQQGGTTYYRNSSGLLSLTPGK